MHHKSIFVAYGIYLCKCIRALHVQCSMYEYVIGIFCGDKNVRNTLMEHTAISIEIEASNI